MTSEDTDFIGFLEAQSNLNQSNFYPNLNLKLNLTLKHIFT